MTACSAHRPTDFDRLLYMIGGFHHQMKHGVFGPHDAEALKLRARINSSHEELVVRILLITELHIKKS
jgi:hypothetical protein